MSTLHFNAATLPATDQGTFTAIISTEHPDRGGDITTTTAMMRAFKAWSDLGKRIPLHWDHGKSAADIVGHVEPSTAKAFDGQVTAAGYIDRSTPEGRQAWRLIKSGIVGFSFGYLTHDNAKNEQGLRVLHNLDLFEISITPQPMNRHTGVVSWKSARIAEQFASEQTKALQRVKQIERILTVEEWGKRIRGEDNVETARADAMERERVLRHVDELEAEARREAQARADLRVLQKHLRRLDR